MFGAKENFQSQICSLLKYLNRAYSVLVSTGVIGNETERAAQPMPESYLALKRLCQEQAKQLDAAK